MQTNLWIAEYHHAFTGSKRLAIFKCPSHLDHSYIADEFREPNELIYNLEELSSALGMKSTYIDIEYKSTTRAFKSYKGYYK